MESAHCEAHALDCRHAELAQFPLLVDWQNAGAVRPCEAVMLLGEQSAGAPLLFPAYKRIVTVTTADGLVMLVWHVDLCSALVSLRERCAGTVMLSMHHESIL